MIGPNPGTALTRTFPSLPAFLTTNHYSLTTAFSAQNSFMIRFRPNTGTSAALAEQTGPPAVPLASRTPLAPPPAAPKLQRRRDSAVLPLPPSLLHPLTSSLVHFFTPPLFPSSTSSLAPLLPCSLGPLFPAGAPGDRSSSLGWLVPCFLTPPPMPSAPTPPVFLPTPSPRASPGPRFLLQFPLFPWSLGPCFCPTPPIVSRPHPPCRFVKL
jgi:hypothetical protein